jgi:hypothetical protein
LRPPTTAPARPADRFALVLALGGEVQPQNLSFELEGSRRSLEVPAPAWPSTRANLAWWWTLFALDASAPARSRRAATNRALVRHHPIPGIEGSTLYSRSRPFLTFSGTPPAGLPHQDPARAAP